MPNIINISNRLPVTVGEKITKSSGGLVSALEGVAPEGGELKLKWIGWPGAAVDLPSERQWIEHLLQQDYGYFPVFLSAEQVEAHYTGFSNASLWPLLHYMPTNFRYEPAWWQEYERVNRLFRDAALFVAMENDLVWVHDYHLMLLPAMLKERMPSLKIGFFLHTPFPSYEVFRCHPNRDELIRGMMGADLLGFHTFGYMRHFRSAVLRLLGIESEMTRIRFEGHTATIGVYPIGINAPKFEEQLARREHLQKMATIAPEDRDKQLVLSVERMDYTKGILNRLDAIETFLESCKDRDSVKFLFVGVPSREDVKEYLKQFEDQTPGSFVEEKRTSLVWHYRKSDPEFGEYKARLLAGELGTLAANEPIVVRHGKKIVEVASVQNNKGAAVRSFVEVGNFDLVVVAGDDTTDESMFKLALANLISIKIGPGETAAKIRLPSPARFRRLLEMSLLPAKEPSPELAHAAQ